MLIHFSWRRILNIVNWKCCRVLNYLGVIGTIAFINWRGSGIKSIIHITLLIYFWHKQQRKILTEHVLDFQHGNSVDFNETIAVFKVSHILNYLTELRPDLHFQVVLFASESKCLALLLFFIFGCYHGHFTPFVAMLQKQYFIKIILFQWMPMQFTSRKRLRIKLPQTGKVTWLLAHLLIDFWNVQTKQSCQILTNLHSSWNTK